VKLSEAGDRLEAERRARAEAERRQANVLFFEKNPPPRVGGKPHTTETWVYDSRTGQHFTLKQRPLTRAHLDDFVAAYRPGDPAPRASSPRTRTGRSRS